MKKITIQIFAFICLISLTSYGQTYTSGLQSITGSLDAQIDINTGTDIVTLTLKGPTSGWLSLGFDSFGHDNKDVVMFDGTNLVDRLFTGGDDQPTSDPAGTHDWTVTSNTTDGGVRTVVATRARVSNDAGDYDFSATPTTLFVVGAYDNVFNIGSFHSSSFGTSTLSFSLLSIEDFNNIQFTMFPNPATSNLEIVLPSQFNNPSLEIFDVLGREIFSSNFNNKSFSVIDVSSWNRGVYLVKVVHENSSQTKRFIKQ